MQHDVIFVSSKEMACFCFEADKVGDCKLRELKFCAIADFISEIRITMAFLDFSMC
jgi:hypothetical protein